MLKQRTLTVNLPAQLRSNFTISVRWMSETNMGKTGRTVTLSPGACLFNFPTPKSRVSKSGEKSVGPCKKVGTTSPNKSLTESPMESPQKRSRCSETKDNILIGNYKDLNWTEYRLGIFRARISRGFGSRVCQGYLRFEPSTRLRPKQNGMEVVSGCVVKGKVVVRLGKSGNSIWYDVGALGMFDIPYGAYYSIKAGTEGALMHYCNVRK